MILVPIDLPSDCYRCPFNYDEVTCLVTNEKPCAFDGEKLPNCTLIEIPENILFSIKNGVLYKATLKPKQFENVTTFMVDIKKLEESEFGRKVNEL